MNLGRGIYTTSFYTFLLSFFEPLEIQYNGTSRELCIKGAKFIAPETINREMKNWLEEDTKRSNRSSASDWVQIMEIILTEKERIRIPNVLAFEKALH